MSKDMFYVWKRNDGYIHATANRMPNNWKTLSGEIISFEHLGTFDVWDEKIIDFIQQERKKVWLEMENNQQLTDTYCGFAEYRYNDFHHNQTRG